MSHLNFFGWFSLFKYYFKVKKRRKKSPLKDDDDTVTISSSDASDDNETVNWVLKFKKVQHVGIDDALLFRFFGLKRNKGSVCIQLFMPPVLGLS